MGTKISPQDVLTALRAVKDPDLHRDIVALGFVRDLEVSDSRVAFTIQLTTPACPVRDQLAAQARQAVQALGVSDVEVRMTSQVMTGGRGKNESFRTSRTRLPWRAARVGWASRPWRPISPWRFIAQARASV